MMFTDRVPLQTLQTAELMTAVDTHEALCGNMTPLFQRFAWRGGATASGLVSRGQHMF